MYMKNTIILLAIFCSIQAYGQSLTWGGLPDYEKPKSSRIDTTYGTIIAVASDDVVVLGGFRIDSIDTWTTQVSCPQGMIGCLVLHWGDVDSIVSSSYWTIDKSNYPNDVRNWVVVNIPDKYILKFIK